MEKKISKKVDTKSLEKSKKEKEKILKSNKIINKGK
jgi:hypothetical protein